MAELLRQEYLICYDIEDTKIRSKFHNELEKGGLKAVQKSVFWGYLTKAELLAIQRYIDFQIKRNAKVLITQTNFNRRGFCYLMGYEKNDFHDWEEFDVL